MDSELPTVTFAEPREHGGRRVLEDEPADVIRIFVEGTSRMLRAHGANSDIEVLDDGAEIVLDTDGEYRYRLLRVDRWDRSAGIYERIRA